MEVLLRGAEHDLVPRRRAARLRRSQAAEDPRPPPRLSRGQRRSVAEGPHVRQGLRGRYARAPGQSGPPARAKPLSDDHGLRTLVTDEIHPTDTPLVSVIVPVFNAERHLAACLSSLLAQTLVPIEIIAVDDGSTDSSPALLAAVSAEGRIRVLTMAGNGGVSAARNSGLEAACAPYVAFVDADDTVDSTMYERLHRAAERGGADIVYCGMRLVAADGALVGTEPPPLSPHHVHDPTEVRRLLHDAWDRRLLWYPFRGIYRRSLLDANDIRFDTGIRKGEDSLFNLEALSLAQRVTAIDEALYDYRKHEASATARPLASESANLERL
ncbi:MAG TPA: glycosyltransferase, partial [Brevibacterium sp.]|nr:glycosyltransferase [Brevibacterium sp.]